MKKFDVVVIGGGPSGSTAAMLLSREGFSVALVEKKAFPREVLCGEFISHEAASFLSENNLFDEFLSLNPNEINSFSLFNENAPPVTSSLGFKGYGLRRSKLDKLLFDNAVRSGTSTYQPAEVNKVTFNQPGYIINITSENGESQLFAWVIICAYGKHNILDKIFNRNFYNIKSGLNGLKYHIPSDQTNDFNPEAIQIYTAENIYCGINKIDDDTITLCYLERKDENIPSKEKLLHLHKNNSSFRDLIPDPQKIIDQQPLYGTGNIYFGRKILAFDSIFFIGDAGVVIAPLAGDGISMALESAQIASQVITLLLHREIDADVALALYKKNHYNNFNLKLRTASVIQNILLNNSLRKMGIILVHYVPSLLYPLIKYTRSKYALTKKL